MEELWAVTAGAELGSPIGNVEVVTIEMLVDGKVPTDETTWYVVAVPYGKNGDKWHVYFRDEPAKSDVWFEEQELWHRAGAAVTPYEEECRCGDTKEEVIDYLIERLYQWKADSDTEKLLEAAGICTPNSGE